MRRLVKFIFFGNLFYGLCAVALSIEAALQQRFPLNDVLFYLLVFAATVLYYNVAYITEKPSASLHPRSAWYARNHQLIRIIQTGWVFVFFGGLGLFLLRFGARLFVLPLYVWAIILLFPMAGLLYYGINHRAFGRINLRDIGWLKPFIIGFSWSGLVTVFPVIYYCITQGISCQITPIGLLLFIKNFMFISLLCILFDIKDYATDYNQRLKTFVVEFGLRRTIFFIIIPLTIAGLGSFLTYGFTHAFSWQKILLNTVPFLLLILVGYSLHRRRSIFYYLVIIDGLMLVKAACGITAMVFF